MTTSGPGFNIESSQIKQTTGDQFLLASLLSPPTSVLSPQREADVLTELYSKRAGKEFETRITKEAEADMTSGKITSQEQLDTFVTKRSSELQPEFEKSILSSVKSEMGSGGYARDLIRVADIGPRTSFKGKVLEFFEIFVRFIYFTKLSIDNTSI